MCTVTSACNGTYSITNFLPGGWVFVGEKIGVGRDRVPNTGTRTIADTNPSISDMNFVLAARGVDVDFTVEDGGGDGVDGVDIVLTKPDGPDQGNAPDVIDTGTTDADGTVTLDALETDVTSSAPMTWTATAESELTATGHCGPVRLTTDRRSTIWRSPSPSTRSPCRSPRRLGR